MTVYQLIGRVLRLTTKFSFKTIAVTTSTTPLKTFALKLCQALRDLFSTLKAKDNIILDLST